MIIKFKLFIRTEKFDSNTLTRVLSNELIKFTKFGHVEPLKNKIDINNLEGVSTLYNENLSIILGGKKDASFSGNVWPNGLLLLGGHLDIKSSRLSDINCLIQFINTFSNSESLLYGYICAEDEFDDKHKVVRKSSYSWKGVSTWDYENFSPGVHWYTIFGKELVKSIGEEKFNSLKGITKVDVEDGSIAFRLNSPIDDLENRQGELKEIEKQLGESYFFGKEKEEGSYSHPEAYKEYLKSFGRGY